MRTLLTTVQHCLGVCDAPGIHFRTYWDRKQSKNVPKAALVETQRKVFTEKSTPRRHYLHMWSRQNLLITFLVKRGLLDK